MSRRMIFGRYDYAAFGMFMAYAVGSVAVPVALVQVAVDLGFPLDEGGTSLGGWLHMLRSVAICAALVAGGFLSGRWGNRKPLGWALIFIGAGMALCAATPTYFVLVLALMVAGLGEGVVEALGTPFVQELHQDQPARYMNFTHGFWSLGVLAATLVFGFMLYAGVSWRVCFAAAGAFAIPVVMLMLMPERRVKYPERPARVKMSQVVAQTLEICRVPRFWIFFAAMILAGGGEFCLTFWVASFVQNANSFAGNALSGGIGTAIFAAGMFIGRTGFGFLMHQRHLKRLMLGAGVLGVAVCLVIPWLALSALEWKLYWFFGVLFLSGIATAPFWPSLQTYAVECLPKCDATMLYILLSCAGIPGCGIFTLLMGILAREDNLGMANSFYLVPACFAGIIALLLLDRKRCP